MLNLWSNPVTFFTVLLEFLGFFLFLVFGENNHRKIPHGEDQKNEEILFNVPKNQRNVSLFFYLPVLRPPILQSALFGALV